MGLFFAGDEERFISGIRRTGFSRYKYVLERNYKELFLVGFISLAFFIPLGAGELYAVLSKSVLVALVAGIVGGAMSAPAFACLEDYILRRMRNDKGDWWACWKRSLVTNAKASILPGIIQGVFIGIIAFASALILWGAAPISPATLVLLVVAILLMIMILSAWWPQVVLFEQKNSIMLKNALFFCVLHFRKMLLCSLAQFAWWAVMVLFMPWTAFALPIIGLWYIRLVAINTIYTEIDDDYQLEEQINEKFPGRLEE